MFSRNELLLLMYEAIRTPNKQSFQSEHLNLSVENVKNRKHKLILACRKISNSLPTHGTECKGAFWFARSKTIGGNNERF